MKNQATPKTKKLHSSGGVLIKDGKVLLIHWEEPRSSYDFPKGGINWLESSEKACVREIFEETGYKTRIVTYIDSNEYTYHWTDGYEHQKKVDYYLVELVDEKIYPHQRERYETFENAWIDVDEAFGLITRDINKEILTKALALL